MLKDFLSRKYLKFSTVLLKSNRFPWGRFKNQNGCCQQKSRHWCRRCLYRYKGRSCKQHCWRAWRWRLILSNTAMTRRSTFQPHFLLQRYWALKLQTLRNKNCRVTVPDGQLSLAIGNKGQNARLAARLTGWKIDIRPESGFFGEDEEDEKLEVAEDTTAEDTLELDDTAEEYRGARPWRRENCRGWCWGWWEYKRRIILYKI